jgi:CS domain
MSRLSDYAKFDQLREEDSEEDNEVVAPASPLTASQQDSVAGGVHRRHPMLPRRFLWEYGGTVIYEWEQSLTEVILFIRPPSKNVVVHITATHVQVGLQGASRFYLDEDTVHPVDTTESTWCWEDEDGLVIYLQKMAKGVVWEAALRGTSTPVPLDPVALAEVQKELMLERWQEEHPGMDFRDATFNGNVPDPRTFMGGVRYD